MSFGRPDLLWLAFALPALIALGVAGFVRRRRRVARLFGDAGLVDRLGAGDLHRFPRLRLALLAGAGVCLGLAAAAPRWGTQEVETRSRALNLVFALDVSKSMLATDVAPNRLERQRLVVSRLLRELQGDRVGLVAFAGRAYVLAPLTSDYGALQLYVDAIDPEVVSQGGSALSAAIQQASVLLRTRAQAQGDRVIVLVTDGEPTEEEGAVVEAAGRAAAAGVVIHTFGIGTAQGAPVPEHDPATGQVIGYKRDPMGEVVVSRLDGRLLERIARQTGGRAILWDQGRATERLVAEIRGMERVTTRGGTRVEPRERFTWFVAFALLLVSLDWVLARRRAARPATATAPALPVLQEG